MTKRNLPLFGIGASLPPFAVAIEHYPGGNDRDTAAAGFRFAENYVCALFQPLAINGLENASRKFAIPAMLRKSHYRGNILFMPLAHSKVTAQGQVSVPAKVRQRLGVGPGSVLEWDDEGDRVVVRKAGRYSSEDIHRVLFSKTPRRRTIEEMKNGIRRYIKKRHAGR